MEPKFHYHVHSDSQMNPVLNQTKAVYTLKPTYTMYIRSILILQLNLSLGRTYEGVSKSFRTGHLERELQMLQLSATRCSFIAVL